MLPEDCSLIGYVSKTHGTGGQVSIALNGDFGEELEPGEPVFLEINGTLVPFFIEESEDFPYKAIVKLEFIDSIDEARKYVGCKVYFKTSGEPRASVDFADDASVFIGYTITDDASGFSGVVTGIAGIESNPLFEVKSRNREFLIPIQPDLMTDIDHSLKTIKMDLPEGLVV